MDLLKSLNKESDFLTFYLNFFYIKNKLKGNIDLIIVILYNSNKTVKWRAG